jgi:hypothetical protein
MGEKRNAYKISLLKARKKETTRKNRRREEGNIKMDLIELGWDGMGWIHLARDRDDWWALVNTVVNLQVA